MLRNFLMLALVALFFSGKPSLGLSSPDLIANLIVPISTPDGSREISMDRYPRFHVQLVNISDRKIRLWKDWNSWGWFNLSLEFEAAGEKHTITRRRTVWDGDFSDFWQIGPGESVILEVDMTSGQWTGMPDLYGETINGTLRATYENKADPLSEAFGIWTGKIQSNALPVVWH